jgi:hypothetical protein
MGKFKVGDRVKITAETAQKLGGNGLDGIVLEASPNQGTEGQYRVIFDGENQPRIVSGHLLTRL